MVYDYSVMPTSLLGVRKTLISDQQGTSSYPGVFKYMYKLFNIKLITSMLHIDRTTLKHS